MISKTPFLKKARLIQHLRSEQPTTTSVCLTELNISRRTFFRYIDELRDLGANIAYSKIKGTYEIENDFDLIKVAMGEEFTNSMK